MQIIPFTPRVDEDAELNQQMVISRLEEALQMARSSKVCSIAIVMHLDKPESAVVDCWHNGGQPYLMLGALESLKIDFVQACTERR